MHPLTRKRFSGLGKLCAAFLFIAAISGAASVASAACSLSVTTDRADARYKAGEEVTFTIDLKHDGGQAGEAPTVNWTISQDGVEPIRKDSAQIKDGKLILKGRLDKPGFLRCEVTLPAGSTCGNEKMLSAIAAAAFAPEEITPSMPAPEDFDAFWAAQKALLKTVHPEVTLTVANTSSRGGSQLKAFDVQADAADGIRVSGYLVYPADAKPRSLPAILTVHGAGVRSSMLPTATRWAEDDMLAMDINAHGVPNGKPTEFYNDLFRGELRGYNTRVPENREEVYFRKMFLRVLAAIEILTARPEWDGKTLILYGTSQGGAQALAAAALDERVSFAVAGVSAMCDLSGMVAERATGWPRNVPAGIGGKPDPDALNAMRYYDMMNFAPRIKVPVAMTVGFIDKTCPPTTVYAAYNNLGGEKTMYDDVAAGHTNTAGATAYMRGKVFAHIDAQSAKK